MYDTTSNLFCLGYPHDKKQQSCDHQKVHNCTYVEKKWTRGRDVHKFPSANKSFFSLCIVLTYSCTDLDGQWDILVAIKRTEKYNFNFIIG